MGSFHVRSIGQKETKSDSGRRQTLLQNSKPLLRTGTRRGTMLTGMAPPVNPALDAKKKLLQNREPIVAMCKRGDAGTVADCLGVSFLFQRKRRMRTALPYFQCTYTLLGVSAVFVCCSESRRDYPCCQQQAERTCGVFEPQRRQRQQRHVPLSVDGT